MDKNEVCVWYIHEWRKKYNLINLLCWSMRYIFDYEIRKGVWNSIWHTGKTLFYSLY
jgi:hypothetical protein